MNILLTCAGRRNYIVDYFRETLKDEGGKVYAANSVEFSTALRVAEKGIIVPSIYDPSYVDVLIRICHEFEIRAIIPLFDLELPILAKARERLEEEGITAIVSSPEVVNICNDKLETNYFLKRTGIKSPLTFLDQNSALEAITLKQVNYPLIIKPRWGMGSIGVMETENQDEMRIFFAKASRVIEGSYLNTESNRDISRSVMIQEKLNGQEFGLDIINDLHGEYVTTIVKKKLAMRSGETDIAETVDAPKLQQLGEKLGTQLGHIGNLDVDVFINGSGTYVLEMNPRFGGGYPFSHLAGANLPKAIITWLNGQETDKSCFDIGFGVVGMKGIQPMKFNHGNIIKFE
jgi:carbamoyl-phosphate synthase large subunit